MDRDDLVEVLSTLRRVARNTLRKLRDGADGFEVLHTFMAELEDEIEYQENR